MPKFESPSPEELARKAEEERETPETRGLREISASLGDKFNICRDAWEELGRDTTKFPPALLKEDKKTFYDRAFLETARKLNPAYLVCLQRLIKEDVDKFEVADKKLSSEEIKKHLADMAATFIKRLEFFSRLRAPEQITIGGKTVAEYEKLLREASINVSEYAEFMMHKKTTTDEYGVFSTLPESEKINLVRLTVQDLFGDDKLHSIEEIYKKRIEFALELCPAEVGPAYRLAYTEQPVGEWLRIAMKQISDPGGFPYVFYLARGSDGVWLRDVWAEPGHHWRPEYEIVFRLPGSRK